MAYKKVDDAFVQILDKCAIYDGSNFQCLAVSDVQTFHSKDTNEISLLWKAAGDDEAAQNQLISGLHYCGVKYMYLQSGGGFVLGKLKKTGIVCWKTNKLLLVGLYDEEKHESTDAGTANTNIALLRDELIEQGY